MNKNPSFYQRVGLTVFAFIFVVLYSGQGFSASLNDIYDPIISRDKFLYQAELYSFDMSEEGIHGDDSFGDFYAGPKLLSLFHSLRFSPAANMEIKTGYGQYLPQEYTRYTYDGPTPALNTVQDHTLDSFQDYFLQWRFRKNLFETYITIREKRPKKRYKKVKRICRRR